MTGVRYNYGNEGGGRWRGRGGGGGGKMLAEVSKPVQASN